MKVYDENARLKVENERLKKQLLKPCVTCDVFNENDRLKEELAKLREIIGLVNYYFEVRAKDPQCVGEVFRDLGQKMQALKGE